MDFTIDFTNTLGVIQDQYIDSFSFITDLFNMYATGKLILKDYSKQAFNLIKMGQDVKVILRSENRSYVNYMKVFQCNKVQGPVDNFTDIIDITLISSWYFVSTSQTRAFHDHVGAIVANIFTQDFSKNTIGILDITSGSNDKDRFRYQLYQSSQDFMASILKYGIMQKLPVYLFTDAQGRIRFKGVSEFLSANPTYTLIPDLGASEIINNVPLKTTNILRLANYRINSDAETSASIRETIFTSAPYEYKKDVPGSYASNSPEANNAQSGSPTPMKVEFTDWSVTPEDAVSISAKKAFEDNIFTFSLVGNTNNFQLEAIQVGSMLGIRLPFEKISNPYNGKMVNLGEGAYLVTHVEYIYSNNLYYTKFVAAQAKF